MSFSLLKTSGTIEKFGRYFLTFLAVAFPTFTLVTGKLFPPTHNEISFFGLTVVPLLLSQLAIGILIFSTIMSWKFPQYFQLFFTLAALMIILTLAPTIIAAPERLFDLNRAIILVAISTLFVSFWQILLLILVAIIQPFLIKAYHLTLPNSYLMIFLLQIFVLVGVITLLKSMLLKAEQQLEVLHGKLYQQATYDELTQLLNRKAFFQKAEEVIALLRRQQKPFILAMIDLDRFKQINDTYGHLVGDEVLKRVAFIFRQSLKRKVDLVGRYGGDELVVLLPDTSMEEARKLFQKIQRQLDAQPLITPSKEKMTASLSIGLVGSNEGETLEELIAKADQKLYQAKSQGRHQVVF